MGLLLAGGMQSAETGILWSPSQLHPYKIGQSALPHCLHTAASVVTHTCTDSGSRKQNLFTNIPVKLFSHPYPHPQHVHELLDLVCTKCAPFISVHEVENLHPSAMVGAQMSEKKLL